MNKRRTLLPSGEMVLVLVMVVDLLLAMFLLVSAAVIIGGAIANDWHVWIVGLAGQVIAISLRHLIHRKIKSQSI